MDVVELLFRTSLVHKGARRTVFLRSVATSVSPSFAQTRSARVDRACLGLFLAAACVPRSVFLPLFFHPLQRRGPMVGLGVFEQDGASRVLSVASRTRKRRDRDCRALDRFSNPLSLPDSSGLAAISRGRRNPFTRSRSDRVLRVDSEVKWYPRYSLHATARSTVTFSVTKGSKGTGPIGTVTRSTVLLVRSRNLGRVASNLGGRWDERMDRERSAVERNAGNRVSLGR